MEWFVKITVGIIAIGYFVYFIFDRNIPSDVVVTLTVITVVILFSLLIIIKFNQNKPYNFLKIQDNILYISTKNSTLWRKPIHEIVEITLVEPKIKWKLVLKNKSLIFKTQNDSYTLDLQYSKFDGYSLDDVVKELKATCNLKA